MDTLLAKLPSGAVMAFLMLCASFYVVLVVAKEDSKYSLAFKRIVLLIAWTITIISLLIFFISVYEILIPFINSMPLVKIPVFDVAPSTLVNYILVIVIIVMVVFISSYITRKLERFLPKPHSVALLENTLRELQKEAIETSAMIEKAELMVKDSTNMAKESVKMAKQTGEFTKALVDAIENNKTITKPKTRKKLKASRKIKG